MKTCGTCKRWEGGWNGARYIGDCTLKLPPWAMAATDQFQRVTEVTETCDFHEQKEDGE